MTNVAPAVIGAGIVSFLPGMDAAQASKVKLALAMAERATQTAYREGLIENWFDYYRNQLKFMGWDSVSPEQAHSPDRAVPNRPIRFWKPSLTRRGSAMQRQPGSPSGNC